MRQIVQIVFVLDFVGIFTQTLFHKFAFEQFVGGICSNHVALSADNADVREAALFSGIK